MIATARRLTTLFVIVSLAAVVGCNKSSNSSKGTKVRPDLPAANTTDSK